MPHGRAGRYAAAKALAARIAAAGAEARRIARLDTEQQVGHQPGERQRRSRSNRQADRNRHRGLSQYEPNNARAVAPSAARMPISRVR